MGTANGRGGGNGKSPVTPAVFAAELARLPPRQRLDALISQKDARRAVRRVPAQQLYQDILEVGLADCAEIVQLASPEQVQTFVDLAAWKRDRLDPHQVLRWLRAARGEGGEEYLAKLRKLDLEVLEHTLRALVVVHDLEENPDVNPAGVTMETPEGRYLLELKAEGAALAGLRNLLNELFADNAFETTRLLEALRWEVPTELEETAYQFRQARLADLGFPTLEEAAPLFAQVDLEKLAPAQRPHAGGGTAPAPEAGRVDYLESALRGLDEGERTTLLGELRYLANAALVVEAADPGDLGAVKRVGELVRESLSLGLEYLTGGDATRAAETVREHPLKKVFQVAFTLTLRLKFQAERLVKDPLARLGEGYLVFDEEAAALSALRRPRPLRALRVPGAEPVPFRTRREIREAQELIARAARQVFVLRALLGPDAKAQSQVAQRFEVPLEELGAERLFTSALVQAVLDGAAEPMPLVPNRTVELCERLFEAQQGRPALRPAARDKSIRALELKVPADARPEVAAMVDRVLARLSSELGPSYLKDGQVPREVVGTLIPLAGNPSV